MKAGAKVFGRASVMAQRREPPNSLDFFPTPPWATRALMRHVLPAVLNGFHVCSAWDPACGEGHMAEVLREDVAIVKASDVFDYGRGYAVADFLDEGTVMIPGVDLIATNPPFNVAIDFVERALAQTPVVAMLLRLVWLEGEDRYERLFRDRPPAVFAPSVERVAMLRGRWEPAASSATAYAWFVWVQDVVPRAPLWIPPGRKRALTLPSDAARFAHLAPAPLLMAVE
jgi:hypothetical protein